MEDVFDCSSRLTEKDCHFISGYIHFIVMDHDLVWSNDFEGEAFLEISKISGINHDNRVLDEMKLFELALTHPKSSFTSFLFILILLSSSNSQSNY